MKILGKVWDITIPMEETAKIKIRTMKADGKIVKDKLEVIAKENGELLVQ